MVPPAEQPETRDRKADLALAHMRRPLLEANAVVVAVVASLELREGVMTVVIVVASGNAA